MKYLSIFFTLIFFSGCQKGIYIVNTLPVDRFDLTIDNTYTSYIRQVFAKEDGKSLSSNNKVLTSDKLIEIQYLLVSKDKSNVLYFTTVPDKRQQYYSTHHLGTSIMNAYDLNTFHFGKLNGKNQVLFTSKDGSSTDSWIISERQGTPNQIHIESILNRKNGALDVYIPVGDVLKEPLYFTQVPPFKIVYYNPFFKPSQDKNDLPKLMNNTLSVVSNNGEFTLYMPFNKPIGVKNTIAAFRDYRLEYSPLTVFARR